MLNAFISELEAEQDRFKTMMAEQQTTSPNNILEEEEKVLLWTIIHGDQPYSLLP